MGINWAFVPCELCVSFANLAVKILTAKDAKPYKINRAAKCAKKMRNSYPFLVISRGESSTRFGKLQQPPPILADAKKEKSGELSPSAFGYVAKLQEYRSSNDDKRRPFSNEANEIGAEMQQEGTAATSRSAQVLGSDIIPKCT